MEHLHLIQDAYGHLSASHLAALAAEHRISQTEVYEVATFYAHFDVRREGEAPPPALTIRVCDSLSCALNGADSLRRALDAAAQPDIRVVRAPCMGRCHQAPAVEVGHRHLDHATAEAVFDLVRSGNTAPEIPLYQALDEYRAEGGYALLADCRAGRRDRESVIAELEASGLRGMGGAGFPAGRKWRFVLNEPGPRLMAINADEGEPGTFKDRYFLESTPHRVLEGMLIAAWAVEAEAVYFYLRDEYPAAREILLRELNQLQAAGIADGITIELRRGAGAYICGEESAMLESIEGKRGLPRHKPPFPAQVGLFGRPTLIHNVETVFWIPAILSKGAAWWSAHGRNGRHGLRSFSVSGRVRDPGVKIAPAGITLDELVTEYCGGMLEGHTLKGYLPGGASGGILPASMADIPLDFGTLELHGCFIGSAAIVVLSNQDDMRLAALNLLIFFEDESCGQCTPCRIGTEKMVGLLDRKVWDPALIGDLAAVMRDASICGLGQAAPNPVQSVLKHFPQDVGLPTECDGRGDSQ